MLNEKAIKLVSVVQTALARAHCDERGQGTLEYAVIVVVCVTVAVALGVIITRVGGNAGTNLTNKAAEVFTG